MRENFTSINIVLDQSGSMGHLRQDTIGSFNTFLKDQKAFPGEAAFTLRTFNSYLTSVCEFLSLTDAAELNEKTYNPSGGTALLDAIAQTVDDIGSRLSSLSEDQRPSKVLVVVITDGQENSSHRFTLADVKQRVQHQTEVYSWQFVFLGASLDQINDAVGLGVTKGSTLQYATTKAGLHSMYNSLSTSTSSYRSSAASVVPKFFSQPPVATPLATPSTGGTDSDNTTDNTGSANKPVNRHNTRDLFGRFTNKR